MQIKEMSINDYEEVFLLWKNTEGIGLHDDVDSKAGIRRYLKRNSGLSFVARENEQIIGTVLCGHDGRRGYLHHLAVADTHRKKGIGKALVGRAIAGLRKIGIQKCHLWVFENNFSGQRFWNHIGWTKRKDICLMSRNTNC
jgi:N-acetylglutamate synthase